MVENGIDLSRFLSISRRAPGQMLAFGSFGRLERVKGHEILLRAFASLRKEHPFARLRILGDGALRDELRVLAGDLSISNNVSFEGFSLDTPFFLGNTDIFVISSLSEGLPLTLLEAKASGLPVVATAVRGVAEIIETAGCGWLCAPASTEELKGAMQQALLAPDLGLIGERGREAAKKSYSVGRMASDYEQLYDSLLA